MLSFVDMFGKLYRQQEGRWGHSICLVVGWALTDSHCQCLTPLQQPGRDQKSPGTTTTTTNIPGAGRSVWFSMWETENISSRKYLLHCKGLYFQYNSEGWQSFLSLARPGTNMESRDGSRNWWWQGRAGQAGGWGETSIAVLPPSGGPGHTRRHLRSQ